MKHISKSIICLIFANFLVIKTAFGVIDLKRTEAQFAALHTEEKYEVLLELKNLAKSLLSINIPYSHAALVLESRDFGESRDIGDSFFLKRSLAKWGKKYLESHSYLTSEVLNFSHTANHVTYPNILNHLRQYIGITIVLVCLLDECNFSLSPMPEKMLINILLLKGITLTDFYRIRFEFVRLIDDDRRAPDFQASESASLSQS